MNKIKISNEQERIKIALDFENIEAARAWFSDEECISDVVEILDYSDEQEESNDVEAVKEELIDNLRKANDNQLAFLEKILQTEINNRKDKCCTNSK